MPKTGATEEYKKSAGKFAIKCRIKNKDSFVQLSLLLLKSKGRIK